MRELLAKLAAASGQPAPEERTDADLMYEAMLRWNGEPPGSAAIDRALDAVEEGCREHEARDGGEGPHDVLEGSVLGSSPRN